MTGTALLEDNAVGLGLVQELEVGLVDTDVDVLGENVQGVGDEVDENGADH